ncbi:MAG: carbohydrate kinase family protein [Chloroflexi bacterium]|nr:carbohydrate kinase family protein [Chloroflexota bacterium]
MKTVPDIDVIGFGALNTDHLYQVDRLMRDGEGVIEDSRVSVSGSAANTVFGAARLGLKTGLVGVVGDDEPGRQIVKDLASAGVEVAHVKVKTMTKTGSVLTLIDRKGNRVTYSSPGANDMLVSADVELAYACRAQFLHLSSFIGWKQMALQLDLVENMGTAAKVSLCPAMLYTRHGLGTLAPLLRRTHVLFLNREELRLLTGEDTEPGAAICHKRGVKVVVVTLSPGTKKGNRSVTGYVYDGESGRYIYTEPVAETAGVDAAGVRDAFAAGFLFGLVNGKDLGACGALGDAAARLSSAAKGAREGLPSLNQLRQAFPDLM